MNIQTIPLNKLVPSPANVRKTGASTGIGELAASIEAHGLLQNLQVRPGPKGKYEVVAGARRHAALNLFARQKRIRRRARSASAAESGGAREGFRDRVPLESTVHAAGRELASEGRYDREGRMWLL